LSKVRIPVAAAGETATSRLPKNIALSAPLGYCHRIGVIDNEQGEPRTVLTNDVSSPYISLAVRVSCMGAGNHGHEHHGYEHHRYEHHRHEYHGHDHHGHDGQDHGHHYRYDNRNDRFHRHHHGHEHHGYDGHHHKHPTKHPAT
jgi:hypothetical protein